MSDEIPLITLDTNILIYAIDRDSGAKNDRARTLMGVAARADAYLTLQALSEFYFATTRKNLLSKEKAQSYINDWRSVFNITAASEASLVDAMSAVAEHRFSFWDAMIWAAAKRVGCRVIFSEDMQHGRILENVEIINPFAEKTSPVLSRLLSIQ